MATPKMFLLALAAGSVAIASPAFAGLRTTEVKTADLNLSQPAGQAELEKRIDHAVRFVCRTKVARNLGERLDAEKCMADAKASATAEATQRIAAYSGKGTRRNVTLAAD